MTVHVDNTSTKTGGFMKKTNFYKKHHLVAVYDEDDNLVAVCDNAREFAETFKMNLGMADTILSRISNGIRSYFIHGDEKMFVYFIPLEKEDMKEFELIY
jgi:hypothetical protein